MSAHVHPFRSPVRPRHLTQRGGERQSQPRIDRSHALCYPTSAHRLLLPPGNQKATDDTLMVGTTTQPNCFRFVPVLLAGVIACSTFLMLSPGAASAKAKPAKAPRPEPELKVLELKISPVPYTVSAGSLEFSAVVQLPKELDGATILEVSSLVTSPSKTSIRFLSLRKPLERPVATPISTEPPKVSIVLTWDGNDHTKAPAEAGTYHFELRAKLLSNGDKGPRTLMVSWPKRGTLEVK